jgi:hypothetical protein
MIKRSALAAFTAIALLAAPSPGPGRRSPTDHPVVKVGPGITTVKHRCKDPKCERCPCATGYHCEGWQHSIPQTDGFYEHKVRCTKDKGTI